MLRRAGVRACGRAPRHVFFRTPALLHACTSLLIAGLALGCASAGDPPGGPPDQDAPVVMRAEPESGAVLTEVPDEARIYFDEVIAERVAGTPSDINGAVLLSPVTGNVRVAWHRNHISVRPRRGFQPGRVYHLQLLPVVTDLRTNRLKTGRTLVFSTGPEIPHAMVEGTIVDWIAGRAAPRALIEAILLPDSLAYRALTDSSGYFRITELPPGQYLVRGVMDTNNDRQLGSREAYDTVGVRLDSAARFQLYTFAHDTTNPRLRTVDVADSMTLKLTFSQPLDPGFTLDTSMVHFAAYDDSTTRIDVAAVYTQKQLDSLVKARTDSVAAARLAGDSARGRATADSARANPDSGRAAPRPAPGPVRGARPPLDSTAAERMLARRPSPTDVRFIRLTAPLVPDTRYLIFLDSVRNLTQRVAPIPGQFRAPRPPPPRPDSLRADSARRDSTARDSTRRDTTRVRP